MPAIPSRPARPVHAGFSLIELMVAVAIIGILASIAYPSYMAYAQRSNRTDATSTLINYAQILQRCYSQTYDYTQCLSTATPAPAGVTLVTSGVTSPQGYYTISVTAGPANYYQVEATPVNGTPQASDTECASFTLQSNGAQGSTGTGTSQTCWGSN